MQDQTHLPASRKAASTDELIFPASTIQAGLGAFSAWTQDLARAQADWLRFLNEHASRDTALFSRLTQCASPGGYLDWQNAVWAEWAADTMELQQRWLSLMGDVTQRQLDRVGFTPVAGT